jgi:hypothetical protein
VLWAADALAVRVAQLPLLAGTDEAAETVHRELASGASSAADTACVHSRNPGSPIPRLSQVLLPLIRAANELTAVLGAVLVMPATRSEPPATTRPIAHPRSRRRPRSDPVSFRFKTRPLVAARGTPLLPIRARVIHPTARLANLRPRHQLQPCELRKKISKGRRGEVGIAYPLKAPPLPLALRFGAQASSEPPCFEGEGLAVAVDELAVVAVAEAVGAGGGPRGARRRRGVAR